MPYYKSAVNELYFFDTEEECILYAPVGLSLATDEEVLSIQASNAPTLTYAQLRASEYPPMEDYLDAVVKGDTLAQQEYIDKCLAIKAKYPKV